MKRLTTLIIIAAAVPAFAALGDVITSFDPPYGADALAWDGQYIWGCGRGPLYAYRMTTQGSIVSSFWLGPYQQYYCGMTFDGKYLWIKMWVPDIDESFIGRYTTNGSLVSWFIRQAGGRTGLAWQPQEGGYLWHWREKLTTTGSLVSSFWYAFAAYDLGWDGHYLWAGRYNNDYVYQFTTTGYSSILASFHSPGGGEVKGCEFDGQYLWVSCDGDHWVYQVDIGVTGVEPASFGKVKGLYR